MSGNVQTLDEQIMCMVDMGFELEDCQAAIENGKLTVNDAVEWILSGKPAVASSVAPVLKLKFTQNSQMDAQAPAESAEHNMVPMDVQNSDASTSDVTSRLAMSDEQKLIKQRFEEKQREEACRLAKAEKMAKKKAHMEALKQIQEDREKHKSHATGSAPMSTGGEASVATAAVTPGAGASSIGIVTPGKEDVSSTLLQIRLPDSRCLKQTFDAESNLQSVRHYVEQQCNLTGVCLLQPFPRREFGDEQMNTSLRELGLVPNGSLVVKIVSSENVTAPLNSSEPTVAPVCPTVSNTPAPVLPPTQNPHNWGSGHQLLVDDDNLMDMAEDEVGNNDAGGVLIHNDGDADSDTETEDDNDIHPPHPQMPPLFGGGGGGGGHHLGIGGHPHAGFGLGPPVGPGGFGGLGGGPAVWGGGGPMMQQHQWGGGGQRLAGEVLENVQLPHHAQDPKQLAADAARKRYGTVPARALDADEISFHSVDIPSLRDLIIKFVSTHICSTSRKTITGLHGLPAALATRIINHLIKEGLLNPKSLQVFNSCRLQDIHLDCYKYCTNELLAVLRHQVFLKTVSLHSCPLITLAGLKHLTALKSLRHLDIGSCQQVNDNCIPVLVDLPSLVTLNLENTAISDSGVIQYASSAPPNLQNLDLSRTNVTQGIFRALQAIPHLTRLNLEQTKVAGLSGVEGLLNLKLLNLANTFIVSDSLLCIRTHPSLIALNISNTHNVHGDTALQYLSDLRLVDIQLPDRMSTTDQGLHFLQNMPLNALDLTNYINITDVGMEYVGHIITLRKLRLSNTKVTDAGMLFIEGLRELRELHLDRTFITDECSHIFRAFSHLQELNLSHTGITNELLKRGALNCCRELLKLNLSKTSISDKGLRRLALPMLTMLNIDDTFVRPDNIEQLESCPSLESVVYRNLRVPPPNEDL